MIERLDGFGAVILCAGLSSRFGGEPKALARLTQRSLLDWTASLFKQAGVGRIVAVAGHRAGEVAVEAAKLELELVVNPDFDSGMYSSVLAGLASLQGIVEGVFFLPVDIPLVRPRTPGLLAHCLREERLQAVKPAYQGQAGHPPLISQALLTGLMNWQGQGGLRQALTELAPDMRELEVDDPYILRDVDSKEDLDRLQAEPEARR